jgi:hypothetical protein
VSVPLEGAASAAEHRARGFESVLAELDWYDGQRAGIAMVEGVPSYFRTDNYMESPEEVTGARGMADLRRVERTV